MISAPISHSIIKAPAYFNFELIEGDSINSDDLSGKVVLITNTASKCGFTNQYDLSV